MRRLRALLIRAAAMFRGSQADREFTDELEGHLQHHLDDNIRAGMTPDQARRDAVMKLGGIAQTRERYRDRQRLPAVDVLRQDIVYASRVLRKNPGFAATAIVTIALGIGADTAIFSVVNAVLLRPLPFADPDRLAMIFATNRSRSDFYDVASYPDFSDWSEQTHTFSGMTAFTGRTLTLNVDGEAVLVTGKRITASVFNVLGVRPVAGRAFRSDEQTGGAAQVVVLSDLFWQRHYARSPGAIGRTLLINDEPHIIIGVMPASFHIDSSEYEQFYVPLVPDPNRGHGFLRVIARLRPGATMSEAQADLDMITARIAQMQSKKDSAVGANVVPLTAALARNARTGLFVMFGVVGVVLVIACINVAGLLLARGATRQREMAVRAALGADRRRLVRQLLTESLLVAVAGGALGLAVAGSTARLLVTLLSDFSVPRVDTTHTDVWVFAFTMLLSLVTAVLFGVAPALTAAFTDLHDSLSDTNRSATGVRAPRLRSGFVVAETAFALVLLTAAGMLLKTFVKLHNTHPGFDVHNVLALDMWLPQPRFAKLSDRARFYDEALTRVRSTPGVRSAAFVTDLPLNGGSDGLGFHIINRPDPAPGRGFNAGFNIATPGYFATMGIPVLSGREFTDGDRASAPGVIVINQTAAGRFWPDQSPLGRQIALPVTSDVPEGHEHGGSNSKETLMTLTVIGVTGDVHHAGLGIPPRPEIFLASSQSPFDWPWLVLVVRAKGDAEALAATVKAGVREADPNVPISRASTLEAIVSRSIAEPRIYALLVGIFAALAVSLAAVGLYGLVSYSVSQRTHELGIRFALGAGRGQVARFVLGQGLRLAGLGATVGLILAWMATRVLTTLVRSVEPNDPLAFASVAMLLLAIAVAATWLPARRAARVEPAIALRSL
jgi:putative ABC transport system permease protein